MARVRVRQHVNPLSHKYRNPIVSSQWEQVYANPLQPLHLDIGCARGKFLLNLAPLQPHLNFLGIEIREPLVREANEYREQLNLKNVHFLFGNINISPELFLATLPPKKLTTVSIQFPDPWFKHRHLKRRVVQPELVTAIAQFLQPQGTVFLQSDILEIAQEMREHFLSHPAFIPTHSSLWLSENPFPIPTEREIATFNKGQPVYRVLLCKKSDY